MKRREFITLLARAAVPLAARAQQSLVGFVNSSSAQAQVLVADCLPPRACSKLIIDIQFYAVLDQLRDIIEVAGRGVRGAGPRVHTIVLDDAF